MNDAGSETSKEPGQWPIVKLGLSISGVVPSIKKFDSGQLIRRGFLDPYLQNVVAQDHFRFPPSTKLYQEIAPFGRSSLPGFEADQNNLPKLF